MKPRLEGPQKLIAETLKSPSPWLRGAMRTPEITLTERNGVVIAVSDSEHTFTTKFPRKSYLVRRLMREHKPINALALHMLIEALPLNVSPKGLGSALKHLFTTLLALVVFALTYHALIDHFEVDKPIRPAQEYPTTINT